MNCTTGKAKIFLSRKRKNNIAQLVSETILNLRCFLIQQKVDELQQETLSNNGDHHQEVLEDVVNYHNLKKLLAKKLNRVI